MGRGADFQEKVNNNECTDLNRKKMEERERKLVASCAVVLFLLKFCSTRELSAVRKASRSRS